MVRFGARRDLYMETIHVIAEHETVNFKANTDNPIYIDNIRQGNE